MTTKPEQDLIYCFLCFLFVIVLLTTIICSIPKSDKGNANSENDLKKHIDGVELFLCMNESIITSNDLEIGEVIMITLIHYKDVYSGNKYRKTLVAELDDGRTYLMSSKAEDLLSKNYGHLSDDRTHYPFFAKLIHKTSFYDNNSLFVVPRFKVYLNNHDGYNNYLLYKEKMKKN